MEKPLKCVLLLSLKEMALRRVAVTLCSGSDVILPSLPLKSFVYLCGDRVHRVGSGDKIKDKISKLELPEELKKQMNDIVRPIALEVVAWKVNQFYSFNFALHNVIALLDSIKLCWTTSGTINFRQTAEQLLLCDDLDVKECYEIACHYCLEDAISLHWEELSEEEKGNYGKSVYKGPPYWWSCILKGEHSELDYLARRSLNNLTSFHQFAFEKLAAKGCKTAAEYFFQKLTREEREASLMRTARRVMTHRHRKVEKRYDLLCNLLSAMTSEQQMEIIKSYPVKVFSCFLHWPLQDLLSDNAALLWTFLPPSSYAGLVNEIDDLCRHANICFPKMFKEFFSESPLDFKKFFIDEEFNSGFNPALRFLSTFFKLEDSESIEIMFRSLDAADRVKLVFQRPVFELFYHHTPRDRWHLVEVCLREATLSKEEKGRLIDTFERFLIIEGRLEESRRFFELFDETDASSVQREKGRKRKLENGSPEQ